MWYPCKKKIALALFVSTTLFSSAVSAHGYDHRGGDNDWLAPLIVGGVVGYIVAQPRTVVVQQPYYTPLPAYVPAEPVYQYQTIYDNYCRCYRQVLVQIN